MACGSAEDLSSGVGTKTIPLKEGEFKSNGLKAMKLLVEGGLTEVCAAGIVGNMVAESSLNPTVSNKIGAYGLCQWLGDRKKNLINFKKQKGAGKEEVDIQVEFILNQEMNSSAFLTQERYNQFINAGTPALASYYFGKYWERPSDKELRDSKQKRADYAQTFYDLYQKEIKN